MTDRRLTDLSYGHPGRATYDVVEHQWTFSVKHDEEQNIRQILPFKRCLSPSLQTIPDVKGLRHSHKLRRQLRQLTELNPELYPGFDILNSISKSTEESELPIRHGNLFVTGRAPKRKRVSRFVATPCGEAGHILRLIESQDQLLGWDTARGTVVTSDELNPASQGFWTSIGGTIRQICSSIDADETSTWLAVRQDAVTTIFRPYFAESQSSLPSNSSQGTPSRLVANPVASLTTSESHLLRHEDISFNPWYTQQFILVDTNGCWGIWNIERQRKTSFTLVVGKRGYVTDGIEMDQTSITSYLSEDGWYRALWVSTLATIVVCSRHLVAVFDLKARPARLQSISFAEAGEQILDVKRSFSDKSHLFVLTSNRIFWIEVTSGDGVGPGEIVAGARVLLSYRHYRDPSDETLALSTINDDQVPVLMSSGKTPIINVYGFAVDPSTREPTTWQGSFVLSPEIASNPSLGTNWESLYFAPLNFVAGVGEDDSLADDNVRFLQVWIVSSDIAVRSTICIAYNAIRQDSDFPEFLGVPPSVLPNTIYRRRPMKKTQAFIDSDSDSDEGPRQLVPSQSSQKQLPAPMEPAQGNLHPTIDFRHIFNAVFKIADSKRPGHSSSAETPSELPPLSEILENLGSRLTEARQSNGVPRTSLSELTGHDNLSGDLDKATAELHEFLCKVQNDDDGLDQFEVAVFNISGLGSTHSGSDFDSSQSSLGFLDIYDHLVDIWMSALPLNVPVQSRLSKYNAIRRIATSLCFSSFGISIQPRVQDITGWNNDRSLLSPEMTPDPSQGLYAHLPTPSYASSSQSLPTDSHRNENPAITRLRKYTVSIQSQPVRKPSKLLSEWVLDANPTSYTWQDPSRTDLEESFEEDARRKRRAESKRKKLMRQDTAMRAATVESQTSAGGIGSQPLPSHDTFSSQPVVEVPMTQPLGGMFGSRITQKGKKNKGKHRKAGF
ncbi:RNA polymerase I-specific transcription initiation factor RRN6-like protein [Amylocarpus encephaloides]|uniref:RNA polymerase I-specific transcription initiation factor RRN6-like protein n=1 Tax=Amylocarpus encephaloides TaxID=45428 RepID=A0A9P7YKE1_9HELO|nr:RNA polymerase I-specific transcription initiation factor RRN6-like protein [Amylocarpus encephaloides]